MMIFVTGASGYIGQAIVKILLRGGLDVVGLARSPEAAKAIEDLGAKAHRGNLREPAGWTKPAADADGVVHLGNERGGDTRAIDEGAVAAMVDALAGTDKPLIYTSGVWVMGSTGDRLAGEMWPLKPPPVAAWRVGVERIVQDSRERKTCGVVIRPAVVYGGDGGLMGRMAAEGRQGAVRVPGDGENHWSFVHLEDLAELYLAALEKAPAGEVYVAADGPAIKLKDVAAAAARQAGGRVEFVPADEARRQMGPVVDALLLDQRIGSTKAGRQLGWKPWRPGVLDWLARS